MCTCKIEEDQRSFINSVTTLFSRGHPTHTHTYTRTHSTSHSSSWSANKDSCLTIGLEEGRVPDMARERGKRWASVLKMKLSMSRATSSSSAKSR